MQTNQNREVEPGDLKKAIRQDRVIAGGPKDFMEVRHIVLRGTNEEIGLALATIARERYGLKPEASSDLLRTRAQRWYFEKNYPILHDRMRGVASANFRLHQHLDGKNPPSAKKAEGICSRYHTLAESISAEPGKMTVDVIKKNHKAVDATSPAALLGLQMPIRTLWHALYFPEQRKLQVSFYLGEGPDQEQPNNIRIRRSEYLEFALTGAKTGNEGVLAATRR